MTTNQPAMNRGSDIKAVNGNNKEGVGGTLTPKEPSPQSRQQRLQQPHVMDAHTLMAPSFVPHEFRQIFLLPIGTLWTAQKPINSLLMVQQLYRSSVAHVPRCLCSNDKDEGDGPRTTVTATAPTPTDTNLVHIPTFPWMDLPGLLADPQFAISMAGAQRSDPRFRRDFVDVERDIQNLPEYLSVFGALLQEEFEENMMLYERYTQYHQSIKPRVEHAGQGKPAISRAILEIPGIFDARPALKPGDIVLLRPMKPVGFHPQYEPVEIQATVINTVRAANQHQKDRVIITWIPKKETDLLGPRIREMAVRFFPTTIDFNRCLTAIKWLTTVNASTSKELLFPSQQPKVQVAGNTAVKRILDTSNDPDLAALNAQQYQFVKMVVSRSADPTTELVRPPMILTGPAGTGKTKTLIKALLKSLELDQELLQTPQQGDIASSTVRPTKRVLLCTPSHTACDVVTRRLSKHLKGKVRLFRLYDTSRPVETVPVEMLEFTRQNAHGEFVLPTMDEFLNFQVVVCTCSDAHLLYLSSITNECLRKRRQCLQAYVQKTFAVGGITIDVQGADPPHFTHLFIDEAAQASEPETLIPLSVVVDDAPGVPKVEIALSGDPRQLNPDVYSRFASPALQKSFLERLLRLPEFGGRGHMMGPPTKDTWRTMDELIEYSFQGGDDSDSNQTGEENDGRGQQHLSVFLSKSYRGHPSFLHIPSKLFYLDKLRSAYPVDTEDATWCRALRILEARSKPAYPCPDKKYSWPILFVGVVGKDTSLAVESFWGSNSWCNQKEAEVVADIVEALCGNGVMTKSIGVMAAFRAQVLYIRRLLRARNLNSVNVGMVEDYQAVEREVIILSLTRSNQTFVPSDIDRNSGLFQQPKRVNVALTRAEDLLIVVGNPTTMKNDPLWSVWLDYCRDHGLWYGEGVSASSGSSQQATS